MFGIAMRQLHKSFLRSFNAPTGAALALVAALTTGPLYALSDTDTPAAFRFAGEANQGTLTEKETRTVPGAAVAEGSLIWTRDGAGSPENLRRIAAIPKEEERLGSGCSK
jgi:hypothetical protein